MELLECTIRNYAWGSRTAIAQLRGQTGPAPEPEAELWMGAHPSAPSRVLRDGRRRSLLDLVAERPEAELGPEVAREFGSSFPFLFKVLAAEQPLSLQAHPSREQAAAGFAEDERRRIPRDAPNRRYPDPNHKPELLCALTEFDALCGFRPLAATLRLLRMLEVPALDPLLAVLESSAEDALARSLELLLNLDEPRKRTLVSAVARSCEVNATCFGEFARECAWALRLARLYPADAGVVVALCLNLVSLAPGEAVYLPPRRLHSYLGGMGVEIMASSDNVLRGGLTPKHVDVPELLKVLEFQTEIVRPLRALLLDSGEALYPTPAREFRLSRVELAGQSVFAASVRGPEILLCTRGSVAGHTPQGPVLELNQGQVAFVSAATRRYELHGHGTVFRAAVGGTGPR